MAGVAHDFNNLLSVILVMRTAGDEVTRGQPWA